MISKITIYLTKPWRNSWKKLLNNYRNIVLMVNSWKINQIYIKNRKKYSSMIGLLFLNKILFEYFHHLIWKVPKEVIIMTHYMCFWIHQKAKIVHHNLQRKWEENIRLIRLNPLIYHHLILIRPSNKIHKHQIQSLMIFHACLSLQWIRNKTKEERSRRRTAAFIKRIS